MKHLKRRCCETIHRIQAQGEGSFCAVWGELKQNGAGISVWDSVGESVRGLKI